MTRCHGNRSIQRVAWRETIARQHRRRFVRVPRDRIREHREFRFSCYRESARPMKRCPALPISKSRALFWLKARIGVRHAPREFGLLVNHRSESTTQRMSEVRHHWVTVGASLGHIYSADKLILAIVFRIEVIAYLVVDPFGIWCGSIRWQAETVRSFLRQRRNHQIPSQERDGGRLTDCY